MFSIHSCCRLCLNQEHEKPFSDCVNSNVLAKIITNIFGFTISPEDKLSTKLCQNCIFKITNFSVFITTVLNNQKTLQRQKEMEEEISLLVPKSEQISDDEDVIFISENTFTSENQSNGPTSEDRKNLIYTVDSSPVVESNTPSNRIAKKSTTKPPFPQEKCPFKHKIKKCRVRIHNLKWSEIIRITQKIRNSDKNNKIHKTSELSRAIRDISSDINLSTTISSSEKNKTNIINSLESKTAVIKIQEQQPEKAVGNVHSTAYNQPLQSSIQSGGKKIQIIESIPSNQTVANKIPEQHTKERDNVFNDPQSGGNKIALLQSVLPSQIVVNKIAEPQTNTTGNLLVADIRDAVVTSKPHIFKVLPNNLTQSQTVSSKEQCHNCAKTEIPCCCINGLKRTTQNKSDNQINLSSTPVAGNKVIVKPPYDNGNLKSTEVIKLKKIQCPPKPINLNNTNNTYNPKSRNLSENQNSNRSDISMNCSKDFSQISTSHQNTQINFKSIDLVKEIISGSKTNLEETLKIQSVSQTKGACYTNINTLEENNRPNQSTQNVSKLKIFRIPPKVSIVPPKRIVTIIDPNVISLINEEETPSTTKYIVPPSKATTPCTKEDNLHLQPQPITEINISNTASLVTPTNFEPKVKILSVNELNMRAAEPSTTQLPIRISLTKTKNEIQIKLSDTSNKELHYKTLSPVGQMIVRKCLVEQRILTQIFDAMKVTNPNQYSRELLQHFGILLTNN